MLGSRHSELSAMNTPQLVEIPVPVSVALRYYIPESWSSGIDKILLPGSERLRTSPWTGRFAEEVDVWRKLGKQLDFIP